MIEEQLEEIAAHARAFYRHGWLYGTSGNMSVRDAIARPDGEGGEGFWMTVTGRHKAELGPEDFIHCRADGRPVEGSAGDASSDMPIHRLLYREDEAIGAVYHAHHIEATVCSERDWGTGFTGFSDIEMLKGFGLPDPSVTVEVPILSNEPTAEAQAEAIARFRDSDRFDKRVPGVNIRGHGLYVWGRDPFAARRHLETFAYLFEYDRSGGFDR